MTPSVSVLESMYQRLSTIFSIETVVDKFADGLVNLIIASIVFLAFYLLWILLRTALQKALRQTSSDATTASFAQTLVKYSLLTLGGISALDSAGIQTSAVIASLGIAGVAIGFAAKDALSNLISGLLIFMDRPFVIGDLVEIDGRYGRVSRITLRSTRIITSDGKMLAVPNTEVINRTVASYTNFPHLRLDIPVTIAVTENIDRVRKILLALVMDETIYMTEPPPRVVVTALNDYNLQMELQVWLDKEHEHVERRFALREEMFKSLTAANVDMPFETLRVIQTGAA